MAINFPNSPSVNDIHSEGGVRWKWNGSSWTRASGAAVTDTITTVNDNSTTTLYPVFTSGTGSQTPKVATTATKNISFDASDGNLTVGGNISAGGTITYEDVKNVDSIGIVTARDGIQITADNKYFKMGAGNDISVVHTGGESVIANATGHLTRRSDVHKWENYNASSEYARIDSSGRVLIGTVNAGTVAQMLTIYRANTSALELRTNTTGNSTIHFTDGDPPSGNAAYRGYIQYQHANDALILASSATERLRIDSAGRVGIGTDTLDSSAELSITNASSSSRIYMKSADNADCSIYFGSMNDSATGAVRYDHSDDSLRLYGYNNSERVRIDSSGRLLVGTTTNSISSSQIAEFNGMTYFTNNSSSTGTVYIRNQYSNTGLAQHIIFTDGSGNRAGFGLNNSDQLEIHGHQGILFKAGGTVGGGSEKVRFTAAGQALVGTTSNRAINSHAPRLQVSGTDYSTSTVSVVNNAADATGAYLFFTKQRSGSAGGSTAVAQDDIIGDIRFTAGDGTDVETGAARITVVAESNASSNSVPSYMRFSTTSTTTPVERLRIDSSGRVLIGTITEGLGSYGDNLTIGSSGNTGMTIRSGTTSLGSIYFSDGTSGSPEYVGAIDYNHSTNTMKFYADVNERLSVSSSGINVTGTVAATSYTGDGSNLTGISAGVSTEFVHAQTLAVVGITTLTGSVGFGNTVGLKKNQKLYFNVNANNSFGDAFIYGDDYNLIVQNSNAAGSSYFRGNTCNLAGGGNYYTGIRVSGSSGDVEFFHNNSIIGETHSNGQGGIDIKESLRHYGDLDTKLVFGTNTISFETAGSERLKIESNGDIQLQGGVIYGDDSALPTFTIANTSGNSNNCKINLGENVGSDNGGIAFYTAGSSSSDLKMRIRGNNDFIDIIDDNRLRFHDGKLYIYHNGSNGYVVNGTGQLLHRSATHTFENAAGSAEYLSINSSGIDVTGDADISGNLYFDSDTDTHISNANTANWIRFTSASITVMDITDSHNVKLHDNRKLWIGASNDIQIYHASSNSTNYYYSPQGNVNHSFAVGASWTLETTAADKRIRCPGSGTSPRVELYYNGTEVLQTSTTGIDLVANKNLKVQTTGLIHFGSGNATIKHTGTHWYFKSNTGDCYWDSTSAHHIRVADNESSIVCAANAGVDLYHNNSKKFGTTSSGIRVWTSWDSNAGIYVDVGSAQNGTAKVATFVTSHYGGERGSIGLTLSGTSYNTSSDYRMKENVVSLTGATSRIKNLKPKRFNFKEDDKTIDGFLAHEVSSVVPEAVTGEKDATEMQQLDYSKLATLTIAALQEAIAKIETLEAEVAALKSA